MFITSFGEQNITYKCCSNFLIHLSLNTGTTVRLKLDHHQRLNMQPNVWEKFNTNQNIQYFTLKEHQFNQLDQAIENFRKEEALLFSKLM